jgi:hypothetical protein
MERNMRSEQAGGREHELEKKEKKKKKSNNNNMTAAARNKLKCLTLPEFDPMTPT